MKRTSFVRVVPGAIELVDWDKVEGKVVDTKEGPKSERQSELFE